MPLLDTPPLDSHSIAAQYLHGGLIGDTDLPVDDHVGREFHVIAWLVDGKVLQVGTIHRVNRDIGPCGTDAVGDEERGGA